MCYVIETEGKAFTYSTLVQARLIYEALVSTGCVATLTTMPV